MDKRSELIRAKKAELQAQLETWALTEGVVGPGEQVVFTLGVQRIPLVTEAPPSVGLLDMPIMKFFTKERCARYSLGRYGYVAGHLRRPVQWYNVEERKDEDSVLKTVRDLVYCLERTNTSYGFRGLGAKSMRTLMQMLVDEGLMPEQQ